MAKIRRVYDDTIKPDGSRLTIYPITSTRAVYTPSGVSLNTILNEGYRFGGIVGPDDRPAFLDQRVWFLGTTPGNYAAFGGVTIGDDCAVALYWDCYKWTSKTFAISGGGGGGSTIAVIDNLDSDSPTDALSAKQGKVLKGMIEGASGAGTLDTTQTTGQATNAEESLSGNVKLHKVSKTGSYNDLLNKPSIPAAVDENTVAGWGFTKNAGTVTKVKINGTAYDPDGSGIVDLGTQGGGGGASQLNDLSDVTLSSPANGQILTYYNNQWVNGALGNLNYEKLTAAQYAARQSAGTLLPTILYIVVD